LLFNALFGILYTLIHAFEFVKTETSYIIESSIYHTCVNGVIVLLEVIWHGKTHEEGKSNDKQVSYGIEIHIYCRFEIPTAVIIPNIQQNTPPTTGSGMVENNAPNFPRIPNVIMQIAPICTTRRLPTY
jgi:hypothetical protein